MSNFVKVIVDKPLKQNFLYVLPDRLNNILKVGHFVKIPFGKKEEIGLVVGFTTTSTFPIEKMKQIIDLVNPDIVIPQEILDLTEWIADYYQTSWGEAAFAATPSSIRKRTIKKVKALQIKQQKPDLISNENQKKIYHYLLEKKIAPLTELIGTMGFSGASIKTLLQKGLVEVIQIEPPNENTEDFFLANKTEPLKLTEEQENAVTKITSYFTHKTFKPFLLHGVTGSGKTEVYLQVIQQCISHGLQAIVLVPEISLTPQTTRRFQQRFKNIAIMHSSLGEQQRVEEWSKIQKGEVDIVVGARSAIFAPLQKLGIIIVDEEHDASYKQDNTPRYHARDLALVRAKHNQAVVVLGSATPSLDSWHNAKLKKYELITLKKRAGKGTMPIFRIVDLKHEVTTNRHFEIFSDYLLQELRRNLQQKLQSIVFVNRKGFYPHLSCKQCKETIKCKACDIRLTVYKNENIASCNYCGYREKIPTKCPSCGNPHILFKGYGTERVAEVLQLLLPEARVLRMDAKTMTTSLKHETAYHDFKDHKYDILVGTQMIAKGLDFPKVTLVGILQIDASLAFLDFRMAERSYQLITQVSGRAGRAENPGQVILQTFAPEHYVIECAAASNFRTFADSELENRKLLFYPPYSKIARILFKSRSENRLNDFINQLNTLLKQIAQETNVTCLGPAPAGIAKLENEYRQQFLIKSESIKNRALFFSKISQHLKMPYDIAFFIDIDPQTTL